MRGVIPFVFQASKAPRLDFNSGNPYSNAAVQSPAVLPIHTIIRRINRDCALQTTLRPAASSRITLDCGVATVRRHIRDHHVLPSGVAIVAQSRSLGWAWTLLRDPVQYVVRAHVDRLSRVRFRRVVLPNSSYVASASKKQRRVVLHFANGRFQPCFASLRFTSRWRW